jgi:hypothetical protein
MIRPAAVAMPRMLTSRVRCSRSSGNFMKSRTYMLSRSEQRTTATTPTKTRNCLIMGTPSKRCLAKAMSGWDRRQEKNRCNVRVATMGGESRAYEKSGWREEGRGEPGEEQVC